MRETDVNSSSCNAERLRLRLHGSASLPTLIHLPGLHGDWTLLGPFRAALAGRAQFVETTYPRIQDWALEDYAVALEAALLERGVTRGWVIGESFSSQVAWQLLARQQEMGSRASFRIDGLILVGGFVRHPWPWGVRVAHSASCSVPLSLLRTLCGLYGRMAGRRYCDRPEILAELNEFVTRRTNEADRRTITGRYRLISDNDLRPMARSTKVPVYHLSGAWDPIVPWWQVRPWLRRNCPGYRDSRILWRAGHNVMLGAPSGSAEQILEWMRHGVR
jgi:pimeloyl-ACP methyl ester carboxylesterase